MWYTIHIPGTSPVRQKEMEMTPQEFASKIISHHNRTHGERAPEPTIVEFVNYRLSKADLPYDTLTKNELYDAYTADCRMQTLLPLTRNKFFGGLATNRTFLEILGSSRLPWDEYDTLTSEKNGFFNGLRFQV